MRRRASRGEGEGEGEGRDEISSVTCATQFFWWVKGHIVCALVIVWRWGDYCHTIHSLCCVSISGTTSMENGEEIRLKAADTTRQAQPPSGLDGIPYNTPTEHVYTCASACTGTWLSWRAAQCMSHLRSTLTVAQPPTAC